MAWYTVRVEMMSTVNAEGSSSNDAVEVSPPDSSLSRDDTFHILQNERRRRVLQYLSNTEGAVDMRDIAEQVAAWEHDTTVQQLTSDQRQRVYIALYQSHLPKLADFDLITYNRSRGVVERTSLADEVAQYLDTDDSGEQSDGNVMWTRYFGGTTAVSIGLIVLTSLGVLPFTSVVLASVITAMYATVTVGFMRWSEN